jgi:hypothetical protein
MAEMAMERISQGGTRHTAYFRIDRHTSGVGFGGIGHNTREREEISEDQWMRVERGILFPVGFRKQLWDTYIMFLIVFSCVDVPFRVGLNAPAEGAMLYFELGLTVSFCTDVCLTFNTAYLDGDMFIIDRKRIAANYFRGWFLIDAASSFPFEVIELFTHAVAGVADAQIDGTLETNQLLRTLRLFRLVRLLRLAKLQDYITMIEDHLRVNLQVINLVKMVLFLVYLMHLLGCFWHFLAINSMAEVRARLSSPLPEAQPKRAADRRFPSSLVPFPHLITLCARPQVTWLADYDGGSALTAGVSTRYLYSVYWALMTLTTVGYGDIVATNNGERLYVLVTLLIGAIVFGYVLSSVGDLISNIDPNTTIVQDELNKIKNYMRWHRVPTELAVKIRKYADYHFGRRLPLDEEAILSTLTPQLRRELQRHLLKKTVSIIELFDDSSDDMLLELHKKLTPQLFEAHEDISKAMGEDGHSIKAIGFLSKGTCAATSRYNFAGPNKDETVKCYEVREPGEFFGEESLFAEDHPLHSPWVKFEAETRAEILYLEPLDLIKCIKEHGNKSSDQVDEIAANIFRVAVNHRSNVLWRLRVFYCLQVEISERTAAVFLQRAFRGIQLDKCLKDAASQSLDEILPGLYGKGAATKKAVLFAGTERGSRNLNSDDRKTMNDKKTMNDRKTQGSRVATFSAFTTGRRGSVAADRRGSSLAAQAETTAKKSAALRRASSKTAKDASGADDSGIQRRLEALERQSNQQAQQLEKVLSALARVESVLEKPSTKKGHR